MKTSVFAMVVAVERYAELSWDLPGVVREALEITKELIRLDIPPENIQVFLSCTEEAKKIRFPTGVQTAGADQNTIRKAITETLRQRSEDWLFFFWGGHGVVETTHQRRVVCADASDRLIWNLDLYEFEQFLRSTEIPAGQLRKQVIIADACGTHCATTEMQRRLPPGILGVHWTASQRKPEQWCLQSCLPGEKARHTDAGRLTEHDREVGYTAVLLQELRAVKSWPPDFEELAGRIQKRFGEFKSRKKAIQTPMMHHSHPTGSQDIPASSSPFSLEAPRTAQLAGPTDVTLSASIKRTSGWQPDVRRYLDDLIKHMEDRNGYRREGRRDVYIDPEGWPEETTNTPSVGIGDYPRSLGSAIAFPEITPDVGEVGAGIDNIGRAPDAVGLRTKRVRSVFKVVLRQRAPLVLLGEPGSGKSTTVRRLVIQLAKRARVIPNAPIPIYVELSRFRVPIDGDANAAIIDFIREAIPLGVPNLRRNVNASGITTPIVVVFDGMDEIPRLGDDDYDKRTGALAEFAKDHRPMVRTVFACRTNDFDPNFGHQQLVLRPFDERRIRRFITLGIGKHFAVSGAHYSARTAACRLMQVDELGAEAGNPLTLSLAVEFMRDRRLWPRGRIQLFDDHLASLAANALRREGIAKPEATDLRSTVDGWAGLAYEIFRLDGAVYIERKTLEDRADPAVVARALRGGVIMADAETGLLKFRHHRLQEFLVARRLRLPNPPQPEWSKILASPRWQETLLNFFAMGGRNDAALHVILAALQPACDYVTRLEPVAKRCKKAMLAAYRLFKSIEPDGKDEAGNDAFTKAQADKYNAARARFLTLYKRERRLRTLPMEDEMNWCDAVLFAARVCAVLRLPAEEVSALQERLRTALAGVITFGRPAAQVRMLSAWSEIARWCPVSVIAPARESELAWVRSQAIHALTSTPLGPDRVASGFSEELEWELLNFHLLAHFGVFWQTAAFHRKRKIQVIFAITVHATFILAVVAVAVGAMTIGIPRLGSLITALGHTPTPLLCVGWVSLVGICAILMVPVLKWPAITRFAGANATIAGLILGAISLFGLSAPEPNWPDTLRTVCWMAGPAIITSVILFILAISVRLFLCFMDGHKFTSFPQRRNLRSTMVFDNALSIAKVACLIVLSVALFLVPFRIYLLFVFLGLVVLGIVIRAGEKFAEEWSKLRWRVFSLIASEIAGLLTAVAIGTAIFFVFYALKAAVPDSICNFLNDRTPSPPDWATKIPFPILFYGFLFSFPALFYTIRAFRSAFAAFRDFLNEIWTASKPYSGTLSAWEGEFRDASSRERLRLLRSLDHRAMGLAPVEALGALHRLETLVDAKAPEANLFHQTVYRLIQATRQQRWSGGDKVRPDNRDTNAGESRGQQDALAFPPSGEPVSPPPLLN